MPAFEPRRSGAGIIDPGYSWQRRQFALDAVAGFFKLNT